MCNILLIDDDKDLCRLLKDNLEREGYKVSLQHRGDFLLSEVLRQPYQLIILDLMLPSKNGYEVLSDIRKISRVPILMLTAMDSEGDKVSCLRMGADDYLTKPFSFSELSARVTSLLRRCLVWGNGRAGSCLPSTGGTPSPEESNSLLQVGVIRIDVGKHEVFKAGIPLELTAKEFDLLVFFASNPGQVFTKRQIYRSVWNEEYAFDDNNITVHIRRLRKKIEDIPESPVYLLTVWGVGYKMNRAPEKC